MKEKWRRETLEEAEKTEPLEQVNTFLSFLSINNQQSLPIKVCSALREEFESQSQKRFEALNKKFIPLVVTDEPSRKVHMLMFILNDSNKTIVFNCRQITR